MAAWAAAPAWSDRATAVDAAYNKAWLEDSRRRIRREPPAEPSTEVLAGLSDAEARFVADLLAGRIRGTVKVSIEERFGPLPAESDIQDQSDDVPPVADIGVARLRRGPRES